MYLVYYHPYIGCNSASEYKKINILLLYQMFVNILQINLKKYNQSKNSFGHGNLVINKFKIHI